MKQGCILSMSALVTVALFSSSTMALAQGYHSPNVYGTSKRYHQQTAHASRHKNNQVGNNLRDFRYKPRFSAGPFYQSFSSSFGLYDLFVPYTFNPHALVFADGRYVDRDNSHEYNVGVGYRQLAANRAYLWTIYGFYDDRHTRFGNNFSQTTVGMDFQTEDWYFNTNGYIPTGKSWAYVNSFNSAYLCQGNARICYARGIEKSMGGWDFEVGYKFWHRFQAYAGGYVFAREGVETAAGPKLRLEYFVEHENQKRVLGLFDRIALMASWRDDQLQGSTWYAGARFDITLGRQPKYTGLEDRMTDYIHRDLNIPMSSDGSGSNAALTQPVQVLRNEFDGQETQVALVAAGTSDAGVTSAIENSRNNIVGFRGASTITTTKNVQSNQVIEGGTYSFVRDGAVFSVPIGASGKLIPAANISALTVASTTTVGQNATIENMSFDGTGSTVSTIVNGTNVGTGLLRVRGNSQSGGGLMNLTIGLTTIDSTVIVRNNRVLNGGGAGNTALVRINFGNPTSTQSAIVDNNYLVGIRDGVAGIRLEGIGAESSGHGELTNNFVSVIGAPAIRANGGNFSGARIVLTKITNNILSSSTSNGLLLVRNILVQGDIANNVITSAATNDAAFLLWALDTDSSVIVNGAVRDNTISNTSGQATSQVVWLRADSNDALVTLQGGLINNTFSGTDGQIVTNTDSATGSNVNIYNLYGNTFSGFSAGEAIVTNDTGGVGVTNIRIGIGQVFGTASNLAAANLGVTSAGFTLNAGGGTTFINP